MIGGSWGFGLSVPTTQRPHTFFSCCMERCKGALGPVECRHAVLEPHLLILGMPRAQMLSWHGIPRNESERLCYKNMSSLNLVQVTYEHIRVCFVHCSHRSCLQQCSCCRTGHKIILQPSKQASWAWTQLPLLTEHVPLFVPCQNCHAESIGAMQNASPLAQSRRRASTDACAHSSVTQTPGSAPRCMR